jgi:uncharacterized protein YgbK (DUF1537 family)
MSALRLGCIADDFTGATDLANTLVRQGMRVVQTNGVPQVRVDGEADAIVVALKTRTMPADDAVAQSLAALQWLRRQGAAQVYFKVCSTFDSTSQGNIGPVAEALMAALACHITVVTPAFPDNGRTVFKGHLFVGDLLLSDSGMRDHPLTPMRDASLVRVLQAQCRQRVGLVEQRVVAAGVDAIRERIAALHAEGVALAIVDAISNDDLVRLGAAARDLPLVVGGSGLAIGLPANWGIAPAPQPPRLPAAVGAPAIVCGSCSEATQRQVRRFIAAGGAAMAIDPLRIAAGDDVAGAALAWAQPQLSRGPVLVYSSAVADTVRQVQARLGAERAGALVERTLAAIARGLVQAGVRRLVVAGGETAGACVQALGVEQMRIGAQIDPGVPWCHATSVVAPDGLHLALKSGNFGGDEFFIDAFKAIA